MRRSANGWTVRGCLLGIVIACAYNLLFINGEIGKLSELSWSEEKAAYGIRLFGMRVIGAAIAGAIVGLFVDRGRRRATEPGWLLGATLLGAAISPLFFTSGTTHGPSIDRGIALYSICGATLSVIGVVAVQLTVGRFRYPLWRILDIMTCFAILGTLTYRYLEVAATL